MSDEKPMGQVIQIDEARIRDHLGEMVRGTVEETLNAMLDAEADRLCGAGRYERSEARQDTRAGSYDRRLQTSAGEVNLKVPKLRRQTFETAIIERYRRRESSVEEALIEMYLAGVSVRRVGARRTNPAGRLSCAIWSIAGSRASSWSFLTPAEALWKASVIIYPRPDGSAAWCIFAGMSSATCPPPRSAK